MYLNLFMPMEKFMHLSVILEQRILSEVYSLDEN